MQNQNKMQSAADDVARHPRRCPLCAAPDSVETPYSRPPWRIVRCAACDFVYQDAAPAEDLLREELAWERTHEAETARRKAERPYIKPAAAWARMSWRRMFGRRRAHLILRKFAAPGPVIDLGCGGGGGHL
ncbi:MAG: hypothetical protein ACR2QC_03015 [Gammaproteobacteria bacterium]